MGFSISTLFRAALGKPPSLVCDEALWRAGTSELHRRTRGRIEAGAFLLGKLKGRTKHIAKFLYYDDIDPTCFKNGFVEFDGKHFGDVWKICRDEGLEVVGDVHVHPGGYWQSQSDMENPMMPRAGHLALILPDFAGKNPVPGKIGIYEYKGGTNWSNHTHSGEKFFYIGWWP
jgi:proteasome lid subunit RPN8/RPN11